MDRPLSPCRISAISFESFRSYGVRGDSSFFSSWGFEPLTSWPRSGSLPLRHSGIVKEELKLSYRIHLLYLSISLPNSPRLSSSHISKICRLLLQPPPLWFSSSSCTGKGPVTAGDFVLPDSGCISDPSHRHSNLQTNSISHFIFCFIGYNSVMCIALSLYVNMVLWTVHLFGILGGKVDNDTPFVNNH